MLGFLLHPALCTDRGRKRAINEDAVGYRYPTEEALIRYYGALFIVADGVAGLLEGERASDFAVRRLLELYYEMPISTPQKQLLGAIEQINSEAHEQLRGSATTLLAAVFWQDHMLVAYVGDSSAFWIDEQGIQKLTDEHVAIIDMAHPTKTRLTRAIGHRPSVEADSVVRPVNPEGRLVLVSDGITRYLNANRIYQLCAASLPSSAVSSLVDSANQAGGADNSSAVVVQIGQAYEEISQLSQHVWTMDSPYITASPLVEPDPTIPPKERTGVFTVPATLGDDSTVQSHQAPTKPAIEAISSGYGAQASEGYRIQSMATPTSTGASGGKVARFLWLPLLLAGLGALFIGLTTLLGGDGESPAPAPASQTPTFTMTLTSTPLLSPTQTSVSPTPSPTNTPSATHTPSPSITPSDTPQPSLTASPTHTPSATSPDTRLNEGDQVRLADSALTYRSIEAGATSAFALLPGQVYEITQVFTDAQNQRWIRFYDPQSEQNGWINQDELPAYEILP
jgi:protein phosphatase